MSQSWTLSSPIYLVSVTLLMPNRQAHSKIKRYYLQCLQCEAGRIKFHVHV